MAFEIRERYVNDVIILDVTGNLDVQTSALFKVRLESLVNFGHHKIVVNLVNVDFIDSTGVGSLMFGHKIVNPLIGGIRLIGLSPSNSNVFSVLNLTEVMSIMHSEEAAVGSFLQEGTTMH